MQTPGGAMSLRQRWSCGTWGPRVDRGGFEGDGALLILKLGQDGHGPRAVVPCTCWLLPPRGGRGDQIPVPSLAPPTGSLPTLLSYLPQPLTPLLSLWSPMAGPSILQVSGCLRLACVPWPPSQKSLWSAVPNFLLATTYPFILIDPGPIPL